MMFERPRQRHTAVSLAAALLVVLTTAANAQEVLGSRVNALVKFDFSTDYITPRGLHVEDQGVVAQPLMLFLWKLESSDKRAISDVTLTTGVWNSFHSHRAGAKPSRWNEVDPILGVSVKLRQGFTIDASTTAFYTPTESYATSTHAEFKVTFNDAKVSGVAINPWAAYWIELNNKSTVMFNRSTSREGSYLTLGAAPTVALGSRGAALEVSAFTNIVSPSFYQRFDGSDGGGGVALVSVAPKVTMPLKGLGVSHGAWNAYAGASYYHLRNDGLLDGNQVLIASGKRQSNLTQLRAGLTVFF